MYTEVNVSMGFIILSKEVVRLINAMETVRTEVYNVLPPCILAR